MRRLFAVLLLLGGAALPMAAQQLTPPGTGGVGAVDRALRLLDQDKRVLLIAAHPDDEDTELLTYLVRGTGADAAYLSLSRGEGGQNLIGPELGEGLGLLRTGELLAARSVDGARQYFTRAFDFGFSKSLDETVRFWPRDSVLEDVLQVMRRLRPQVVITVFSGTPRDGHGQHQMAGVIAREAFRLLQDSAWGPRKLYRTARFDTASTTLRIPTATLDPVAGRSYLQLAMAGRSLHRSQDMGQIQRLGPSAIRLALEAGPGPSDAPLFAGVDTALAPALARYGSLIDSARALLNPRTLERVVPVLAAALTELRRHGDARFVAARAPLLEEALAAAASVVVDATADDARVAPGQALSVAVSVWDAGATGARIERIALEAPEGWQVSTTGMEPSPEGATGVPAAGRVPVKRFSAQVPPDAAPTVPYFLRRPRGAGLYDWSGAAEEVRGEPHAPPPLRATVTLVIGGARMQLVREVSFRTNDQASGEVRRPLVVVPIVGVTAQPEVLVWPMAGGTRRIAVELEHGARGRTEGEVRIDMPAGWPVAEPRPFVLDGEDARRSLTFEVRLPAGLRPGRYDLRVVARVGTAQYEGASVAVDYPHIRPVVHTSKAMVRVEAAELVLPRLRRVGYVRGASDLVPEALLAVGVPLTLLTPSALERGDLSAYDVIIVGSRAYETEPALSANNGRLLDFARAGGRLIVQYQQYQYVRGSFAPFPLRIAAPHDRVTDESAAVRPVVPGHRLFRAPNAIGATDWDGWVQERGLYFAREWDPAFRPLLETGDGSDRLQGGLLIARLGRGVYVYTGLSFFRQLPAGVPGAYRLFANLLGLEAGDVPN
jgi:LmbE family N-acetylglucosaminyl deacetylase